MDDVKRRDALKLGAGALAGAAFGPALAGSAQAADWTIKPEPNAAIRVLRWKRFVQGDEDKWMENTAKYTQATGVKVRVDNEGWEDMSPKAAVAANVGSGPDAIVGWMDSPHLYPDKLVDLTALADYLGGKYGGWYDTPRKYATNKGRWIGLPLGASGALLNYRISWMHEAGFDKMPTDTAGFLKLCQALNKIGQPPGDHRGARIRQGARPDLHPGRAVVERRVEQQRLPRGQDQPDLERHLDLLRRQERQGPGQARDRARHGSRADAD